MKVAVVTHSPVPFRQGGAERLAEGLTRALADAGHAVELVKLPVREYTLPDLVVAYEQFAALDLSHFDAVVTGRYPAWMVDHPHHVVWMLHPLRGLYDTYPASHFVDQRLPDTATIGALRDLLDRDPATTDPFAVVDATLAHAAAVAPDDPTLALPGPLARAVVHHLDRHALDRRRVRRHAAISATVAGRPDYFPPDVTPLVLHPPPVLAAERPPSAVDVTGRATFVAASRLERVKRLDLVVEAFRLVPGDHRLVLAGEGPDADRLAGLAAGDERIELAGRIDDDRLAAAYDDARAVVFCPRDEDYGYVAVEAMARGRGVLTTRDAGGPTELVTDRVEGRVVEPTPVALAAAMVEAAEHPDRAAAWGAAASARVAGLRWDGVVAGLLGHHRTTPATAGRGRPRIVGVSSYPLRRPSSGGPLRAHHLFAAVAESAGVDIEVVSVTPTTGSVERHELAPGVSETVVPLSARHTEAETELRLLTGPVSITDVAVGLMWRATPVLVRELAAALEGAAAAWFVQPYLAPAVAELAPGLPAVYDAHNHERALKEGIYPANEAGVWLAGQVAGIEAVAVEAASLVLATTEADRDALVAEHGLAAARTLVVPNGVDVAAVPFSTGADRRHHRDALCRRWDLTDDTRTIAVFVGSGHGPNIDAGRHLIRLAPDLEGVELLLVGRHAEQLGGRHLPPNVHLLGAVDDATLAAILAGADVALNPVQTGSGSNLKVLTALAAGLPVVSSPVGARGLDPAAGVVTCAPDALATGIATATGPDAASRAAEGRRWVEHHADWRVVGAPVGAMIAEMVRT